MKENSYIHEILVEKNINLKKYLKSIRLEDNMKKYKTYKKLVTLLKKEYSNVKIVSLSELRNKYK